MAVALLCAACCAAADDAVVYRTHPGDTLIGIAASLLQRPADWPRLQRLNRIADPRRMPSGAALRIPVRLLRREAGTASISHISGSAQRDGAPLQQNERVGAGSVVATGEDGYLTLALPDGSSLTLQPRSRLRVESLQRRLNTEIHSARLRLEQGRVETVVPRLAPSSAPSHQMQTPGAVISVRGTRYRAAAQGSDQSRVEVTQGLVGVDSGARRPLALREGFGVLANSGKPVAAPTALLPAPDLAQTLELQERPTLSLRFAPLADAGAYRVDVAADPYFRDMRSGRTVDTAQARIAGLADGDYWLRVRGIDRKGFEGLDAVKPMRLRARPEPPFPSSPPDGTRLRADRVSLRWTQALEAAGYEFQLARDPGFAQILHQGSGLTQTEHTPPDPLAPGHYFWRVASLRADGYRGPYGDAQSFELRAPPAEPEPPVVDHGRIAFAWPGEPGQRFEFQLARDADFKDVRETRLLDQPRTVLDQPAAGTYYMRVRATDADGFVGPYTATQRIEVPSRPWWLLLLLLVPLL